VPEHILKQYTHAPNISPRLSGHEGYAPKPLAAGRAPHHMTGVLFKGTSADDLPLPAPIDWVAPELKNFGEFFTAKSVTLHCGITLKVLSVYSPAFPIGHGRMKEIDTAEIQLTQNRDVWATELLWAALRSMHIANEEPFIVAGDLNSSETFDYPRPRGNREVMEHMNAVGLYDCLRMFKGKLTPTFRTPRGGKVIHQLDHLYVTPMLLSRLAWCDVGSAERVLEPRPMLSDHLPIVADFNWAE
jgi:Endonuclease/Exonuclease/phosphatase family